MQMKGRLSFDCGKLSFEGGLSFESVGGQKPSEREIR